ncbi:hypothetical protein [Burkholderia pseudomallei]|uniref:hypothetical protein n=1 Tax=Burkholderia pseudomallei TaxID=28450 RepID=UPI000530DC1A|nr:hypothetical protein [Burkholderia pseudomallei]KGS77533.1 hypothetical protein X942_4588 [Burkholderia pseudomallei MSHR5596]
MSVQNPTQFRIRPAGLTHVFDDTINIVCQQDLVRGPRKFDSGGGFLRCDNKSF